MVMMRVEGEEKDERRLAAMSKDSSLACDRKPTVTGAPIRKFYF